MHIIQEKLLDAIKEESIEGMGTTEVARFLGIDHPQKVIHHLEQLEKKGYLRRDFDGTYIILADPVKPVEYFPLRGMAQCGVDGVFQEDEKCEQIPIPTKTFDIRKPKEYFFVKAVDDSMQPSINDQDYVLVHEEPFNEHNSNIALVVHNGGAKLKRIEDSKEPDFLSLVSDNEAFKKQLVRREEIRVLGYVHRVISK